MESGDRSWIEIDLSAHRANLDALRAFLPNGVSLMQIVKADAYGHGAAEIAAQAARAGVDRLGVANVEEGAILRYQGVNLPILILSPPLVSEIGRIIEHHLTPTISDAAFAEALDAAVKGPFAVHIEIDTGMGRSGVHFEDAELFLEQLAKRHNLVVEGVFSHFSSAENDPEYSHLQLERFNRLIDRLPIPPRWIHIANSPATVLIREPMGDLVRLGLLSYGVYPDPALKSRIDLRPVMTFKTRIGQIRQVRRGESIGYNRTYIAERDHRYAILPVGYADGYDFLLSNRARVSVNGVLCPVIGKISMDMTAVALIDELEVLVGDEATLLGGGVDELRAENLTALYGGNPYELLCQVGRRARRYYLENGQLVSTAPLSRREFYSPDFSDDRLSSIIEAAIGQRLQSKEIASLISGDILRQFFLDHDREIRYRSRFEHRVRFLEIPEHPDRYLVQTTLTFHKVLQNDYFLVACANRPESLSRYFMRRDVEYRWLLDDQFDLSPEHFRITEVKIGDLALETTVELREGSIEIRCAHPGLADMTGREVSFSIATETYYPRKSHQLSVFITEITRGVRVAFEYPPSIHSAETITVFAGRRRFPELVQGIGSIEVRTPDDEWVFPNSGIVFAY
jgi:alanine racemase